MCHVYEVLGSLAGPNLRLEYLSYPTSSSSDTSDFYMAYDYDFLFLFHWHWPLADALGIMIMMPYRSLD